MKSFTYNDMEFSVEKAQDRWDISCKKADGKAALVAAGLFAGLAEGEAEAKAKAEREARAAAEQERIAMVIANATLVESAREAVELLEDNGLGEHLVTLKLRAAVERHLSTTECAA